MKKEKTIIIIAIIAAGLAFYGGMKYEGSKIPTLARQFQGMMGGNGGTRGMRSGNFVTGQILSKDATSMTVSVQGGGSKIIFFSPSTTIQKTVSGSSSDLVISDQVFVSGTANSDGSITATSIQIRPSIATTKN